MLWGIGKVLLKVLVDAAAELDNADSWGLVRPALVGVDGVAQPLGIVREAAIVLIVGVVVAVVLSKSRSSENGQEFHFYLFSYRKIWVAYVEPTFYTTLHTPPDVIHKMSLQKYNP